VYRGHSQARLQHVVEGLQQRGIVVRQRKRWANRLGVSHLVDRYACVRLLKLGGMLFRTRARVYWQNYLLMSYLLETDLLTTSLGTV
jgi:hypothetical protein